MVQHLLLSVQDSASGSHASCTVTEWLERTPDTVPTAAGTWYVKAVVDGTDNYEGAESEVVSFVIEPKSAETDNQIKVPEMSTDTRLDDLVIKDGDKVLVQGTDYDVTQIQDGNKVVVTITFKGNYTGTVVQAYIE